LVFGRLSTLGIRLARRPPDSILVLCRGNNAAGSLM
jgi:hypothetical protein